MNEMHCGEGGIALVRVGTRGELQVAESDVGDAVVLGVGDDSDRRLAPGRVSEIDRPETSTSVTVPPPRPE